MSAALLISVVMERLLHATLGRSESLGGGILPVGDGTLLWRKQEDCDQVKVIGWT